MSKLTEAITKLKNPYNFVAVASFAIGIVALFQIEPIKSIAFAFFGLFVFLLLLLSIDKLKKWYEGRSSVHFYPNWKVAPKKYGFPLTLKYIGKHGYQLDMIARSGFRLLCGNEDTFDNNSEEYKSQKRVNHNSIIEAVERGAMIGIYLQAPSVIVPTFSVEDGRKLKRHQDEAIGSFKEIHERLSDEGKQRFLLYYVDKLVDNSMTRITGDNKVVRLVFEISVRFLSKDTLSKPFVVFEPGIYDFSEYLKEFDHIAKKAEEMLVFDAQQTNGINAVREVVRKYNQFSTIRNDRSEIVIPIAANSYLSQKGSPSADEKPPVCIQVLVTNECTTHCTMCDHYNLHRKDDLSTNDIKAILDSVRALGTKNIIISGGEPLSRSDIFEILKYARGPFTEHNTQSSAAIENNDCTRTGLNIGLLTNGVKTNGEKLSEDECKIIKDACSWVQISIDGFEKDVYKSIRGHDYLEVALDTVSKLHHLGHKGLEVCYTIQAANIKELSDVSAIKNKVPLDIPIRFKFAHGPARDKDFLCKDSDLKDFITKWTLNDSRFNYPYLTSMLTDKYFDYEGVSSGRPLKGKMEEFYLRKYQCKALDLTVKIDPKGDVYPCCFLFDDNNSKSQFREKYLLGSLMGPAGKILPTKPSEDLNPLSKIWFDNKKLDDLRTQVLPVDPEACSYCTRHFYQNEYMNIAESIFKEYDRYGVAEYFIEESKKQKEGAVWV
jgi:MoaA/NifB/PqqE/SkfB family radical SAM enzyme